MSYIISKLRSLLFNVMSGDGIWALVRLGLGLLLVALAMMLVFSGLDLLVSLMKWASRLLPAPQPTPIPITPLPVTPIPPTPGPPPPPPQPGPLALLFQALLGWLADFMIFFFERRRYLLAPLGALGIAIMTGARYIQDLYELTSYRAALHYLIVSMFGILPYPRLVVAEGKKQLRPDEVNLLDRIGGPGHVIIQPGNLVLFERLRSPSSVRGAGRHFVPRFESIRDIINLEEQEAELDQVFASTKDGLEVQVSNVRIRFRLMVGRRTGSPTGRTFTDPYPFSVQAVENMAYNRNVTKDGLQAWWFAVKNQVETGITDYINAHTLDQLTAPVALGGLATPDFLDKDPRDKIKKAVFSKGVRNNLRGLGAELLWVDIGHFDLPEKQIQEQRLASWRARWEGKAEVIRADAEAQRLRYQEMGRAEAQAEMLMSITRALEDIGLEGDTRDHLRNIVLMRTAQILEALGEEPSPDEAGPQPTK